MTTLIPLPFPVRLIDTSVGLTSEASEQLQAWASYLRRTEGIEVTRSEVLCRVLLTYLPPASLADTT